MRGRKNAPLEITPVPDGAPLTFDTMAQALCSANTTSGPSIGRSAGVLSGRAG